MNQNGNGNSNKTAANILKQQLTRSRFIENASPATVGECVCVCIYMRHEQNDISAYHYHIIESISQFRSCCLALLYRKVLHPKRSTSLLIWDTKKKCYFLFGLSVVHI